MYHLLYTSSAARSLRDVDIHDILAKSRYRNLMAQVTGLLLCRDGVFLQALEGRKSSVTGLLDRIRLDPRHADLKVVGEFESTRRIFPNWSMGYIEAGDCRPELMAELQALLARTALTQAFDRTTFIQVLTQFNAAHEANAPEALPQQEKLFA